MPLTQLIIGHRPDLLTYVKEIFQQGWPVVDAEVATEEALEKHVDQMSVELEGVLKRLRRRLLWAFREVQRLNKVREQQATLEQEDQAHFQRCDRLIKKLKGVQSKRRREAEGVDDINTYGVLAAEGFLPGYGLDTGSVVAMAEVPYWQLGSMDFDLPRPSSIALREYVPGNLIYANGHRFVARRFHRDVEGEQGEMPLFEVNIDREAVSETSVGQNAGALTSCTLSAIPVCDVDLMHQSQISDEEETRFQMSVATYGREQGRHNGGEMYGWGERQLSLRRGVHLRLVNVGATSLVEQDTPELGYPVCTVCGQSVSPLASDAQLTHFREDHEKRCGRKPVSIGFFADIVADCLTLPACPDAGTAYSVLETLRMATAQVLDMHLEDLQVLVIGHVDRDDVDGVLWDPMPGGSGLLQQLQANFQRIVQVAREIVSGCPSACESSCIDCLQTFRNGFYHKYLDRHVALESLNAWGEALKEEHAIPATQPTPHSDDSNAQPVNDGETKLKYMLAAAGFTSGDFQNQIRFKQPIVLDHLIGGTTPDVHFIGDEDDPDDKGICIYLDGMSASLHGDPAIAARDHEIRSWLRNNGYQVIEITRVDLDDRNAMIRHFKKLARHLEGKALAKEIEDDTSWFDEPQLVSSFTESPMPFQTVEPTVSTRYRTCVPLLPLQAAAGGFGDPSEMLTADARWIDISSRHRVREGMFVARVVGQSMEPRIPDGSYCLFHGPVVGTREGKIVLARLRDTVDPETGERFTVKRYSSSKIKSNDGTWHHATIKLIPINPEFSPLELRIDDGDHVDVMAEFIDVLHSPNMGRD